MHPLLVTSSHEWACLFFLRFVSFRSWFAFLVFGLFFPVGFIMVVGVLFCERLGSVRSTSISSTE